jgi:hypothetical protein
MANEALRLIDSSAGRGAEQRSDELNLRELWRAVVRRKFVLLATILVLTGATYAYISQQTPLYTARPCFRFRPATPRPSRLPSWSRSSSPMPPPCRARSRCASSSRRWAPRPGDPRCAAGRRGVRRPDAGRQRRQVALRHSLGADGAQRRAGGHARDVRGGRRHRGHRARTSTSRSSPATAMPTPAAIEATTGSTT